MHLCKDASYATKMMQLILVQSLLCCNLPEGAFNMLVRLAQPSRNVFE